MRVTKRLDLGLLERELAAASVVVNGLGTSGADPENPNPYDQELFTYDAEGVPAELPQEAVPVVDAHTAPLLVFEYAETITVSSVIRTTDDTETDVFVVPAEPKSIYRANLAMSAMDAGNGACKFMEGRLVWKRLLGANVIAPPANITVVSDIHDTAASSWVMNGLPSGGGFRIFVQGAAGRTIDWALTGDIGRYAPGGLEG